MDNKALWVLLSLVVVVVIGGLLWGVPQYDVYCKTMDGRAILAKAENERKSLIEEARAKEEAAKLLAGAEVERAKGVAEANKIIGDSLKGNEGYLRYLWIMGLQDGSSEVIYIPTEAGMPILEASRHLLPGAAPAPK